MLGASASASEARADANADYRTLCASCHGSSGRGDGAAARAMPVGLPDFTSPAYQKQRSDADLERVIRGGAGAFMQPYARALDDARVRALVQLIRGFATGS